MTRTRRSAQEPKASARFPAAIALVAICTALALGLPSVASAQTAPPPPDDSSIDEYVEEIPTSGGGVVPGKDEKKTYPLPPSIVALLEAAGDEDAALLKEIATSSEAGAPQRELAPIDRRPGGRETSIGSPGTGDSPVAAAISAVGGESGSRVLGLLVVLLVITGGALGAALYRHRAGPA